MKSSRTLVLLAAVAGLALAVATSVVTKLKVVADTVYTSCRAFKNLLVDGFMVLATPDAGKPEAVPFAQAKAFKARIEKRARPVITGAWRMCPSI
jgi:hypothetical protein